MRENNDEKIMLVARRVFLQRKTNLTVATFERKEKYPAAPPCPQAFSPYC
jgi:hypothetical protein